MYIPALGQYPVTAYVVGGGGGTADPCADTFFRLTHQDVCGVTTAPTTTLPPPPEIEPLVIAPPTVDEPVQQFNGGYVDPVPEFTVIDEPGVPIEETVIEVSSGGWGAPAPSTDVSITAGDVYLEEEARGFGLVEALLGAGLAWVLTRSYRARRRR